MRSVLFTVVAWIFVRRLLLSPQRLSCIPIIQITSHHARWSAGSYDPFKIDVYQYLPSQDIVFGFSSFAHARERYTDEAHFTFSGMSLAVNPNQAVTVRSGNFRLEVPT